ncbi:MAG TPA: hypothetical protein VGJ44_20265 [Kribbellaceae bacterium]|jgi:hypothetical protein
MSTIKAKPRLTAKNLDAARRARMLAAQYDKHTYAVPRRGLRRMYLIGAGTALAALAIAEPMALLLSPDRRPGVAYGLVAAVIVVLLSGVTFSSGATMLSDAAAGHQVLLDDVLNVGMAALISIAVASGAGMWGFVLLLVLCLLSLAALVSLAVHAGGEAR